MDPFAGRQNVRAGFGGDCTLPPPLPDCIKYIHDFLPYNSALSTSFRSASMSSWEKLDTRETISSVG